MPSPAIPQAILRVRTVLCVATAMLFLALPRQAALAQEPVVRRIIVSGTYLVSRSTVLGYLGLEEGQRLNTARLAESVERLNAAGLIGNPMRLPSSENRPTLRFSTKTKSFPGDFIAETGLPELSLAHPTMQVWLRSSENSSTLALRLWT